MLDFERQQQIREAAYHKWESAGRPCGREVEFWLDAEQELRSRFAAAAVDAVEEASEESFPASDAPSWNPTTSIGAHIHPGGEELRPHAQPTPSRGGAKRGVARTETPRAGVKKSPAAAGPTENGPGAKKKRT